MRKTYSVVKKKKKSVFKSKGWYWAGEGITLIKLPACGDSNNSLERIVACSLEVYEGLVMLKYLPRTVFKLDISLNNPNLLLCIAQHQLRMSNA